MLRTALGQIKKTLFVEVFAPSNDMFVSLCTSTAQLLQNQNIRFDLRWTLAKILGG